MREDLLVLNRHVFLLAGCMAHARRKFFDLTDQGKSQIASEALDLIAQLYGIEREVVEPDIDITPFVSTILEWHRLKH